MDCPDAAANVAPSCVLSNRKLVDVDGPVDEVSGVVIVAQMPKIQELGGWLLLQPRAMRLFAYREVVLKDAQFGIGFDNLGVPHGIVGGFDDGSQHCANRTGKVLHQAKAVWPLLMPLNPVRR